jgi:hypothetical protein
MYIIHMIGADFNLRPVVCAWQQGISRLSCGSIENTLHRHRGESRAAAGVLAAFIHVLGDRLQAQALGPQNSQPAFLHGVSPDRPVPVGVGAARPRLRRQVLGLAQLNAARLDAGQGGNSPL